MDIVAFKTLLAEEYGLTDMTCTVIDRIIARAVKKISEYYPFPESSFITTVAGQTRYSVTHDNIIRLNNVYYNSPVGGNVFNDVDIPVHGRSGGQSLSQQFTDIFEHETQRRIKPVDARIVDINTFDLIPTPSAANKVFYEYFRYRTFLEVPSMFEDELIELIMFYKNDEQYQTNRATNNGNMFAFDRRGNTTESSMTPKTTQELRKAELELIIKSIKAKVNALV